MSALLRYNKSVAYRDELISAICNYLDEKLPITIKEKIVYRSLNKYIDNYRDSFYKIDKEDLIQEINIRWFASVRDYYKDDSIPPEYNFLVTTHALWAILPWLTRQLKKRHPEELEANISLGKQRSKYMELDLGPDFLVNGSKQYPYSLLSNYDRLILHLAFYEDMSDSQIGEVLQRDRIMIRENRNAILDYLRRCINGKRQNTNRFS